MERDNEYELEEDTLSDSSRERDISSIRSLIKEEELLEKGPLFLESYKLSHLPFLSLNIRHALIFVK